MRNKKRNRIFLLLILLLGITVGFALLSTTLRINGTAGIGKSSWNIYWDNVDNEDGVSATKPTITADENNVPKSLVTWNVTFNEPGEYFEFTVDAVNAGSLDAEILEIVSKYGDEVIPETPTEQNPSPVPSYIKYSVKYADGTTPTLGDILAKAGLYGFTRKTYKIRIEYDRDAMTNEIMSNMEESETHSFSLSIKYGQRGSGNIEDDESAAAVSFETDSWDTIAAEGNRAATQTEVTDGCCGTYHLGDTKIVDLGELGVHEVRLANCSTPAVCNTEGFSQTACGFVLEFTDIISTHYMNPKIFVNNYTNGTYNKGGWEYSDMRFYLNGGTFDNHSTERPTSITYTDSTSVYGHIPELLRNQIASTTIVSGRAKLDADNYVTQDKLYLLTPTEVVGLEGEYSTSDELDKNSTRQLDYYHNVGVRNDQDHTYVAKNYNNVAIDWWLRTASANNENDFFRIYVRENWTIWDYRAFYEELGVSPAFKLK